MRRNLWYHRIENAMSNRRFLTSPNCKNAHRFNLWSRRYRNLSEWPISCIMRRLLYCLQKIITNKSSHLNPRINSKSQKRTYAFLQVNKKTSNYVICQCNFSRNLWFWRRLLRGNRLIRWVIRVMSNTHVVLGERTRWKSPHRLSVV